MSQILYFCGTQDRLRYFKLRKTKNIQLVYFGYNKSNRDEIGKTNKKKYWFQEEGA